MKINGAFYLVEFTALIAYLGGTLLPSNLKAIIQKISSVKISNVLC
jgi:hypothetical protein